MRAISPHRATTTSASAPSTRRRAPRVARASARSRVGAVGGAFARDERIERGASARARAREADDDESKDDAWDDGAWDDDPDVDAKRKELLVDTSSSPLREIFSVEALRDASESGTRLERVVGAEFVPQAIIEAERKSSPLRRPRLVVYALSASAAAAQAVMIAMEPGSFESPVASALSDACVMIIGSLLWRVELQQRADTLRLIWEKAKEREESLTRAEAGMGDTIWTARVRRKAKKRAEERRDADDADLSPP